MEPTLSKGDFVTFRTAGRAGISEPLPGVVVECRETARGPWFGIRMQDGTVKFARAAHVERARGRRPAWAN